MFKKALRGSEFQTVEKDVFVGTGYCDDLSVAVCLLLWLSGIRIHLNNSEDGLSDLHQILHKDASSRKLQESISITLTSRDLDRERSRDVTLFVPKICFIILDVLDIPDDFLGKKIFPPYKGSGLFGGYIFFLPRDLFGPKYSVCHSVRFRHL